MVIPILSLLQKGITTVMVTAMVMVTVVETEAVEQEINNTLNTILI